MEIFGIKFDNLTMDEALEKIGQFLKSKKQHYIVLPYSEFIVRTQKDEEFKNILNKADLCLCEGRGLWIMARLAGKKLKGNIWGTDLIYKLSNSIWYSGNSVFLLGGTRDVVEKVKEKLGKRIIGAENGYQNLNRVVKKINNLKPEILLVNLGSPKQERWIYENLRKMPSIKVAIGVGGAFDFISGKIKRAPRFIQKTGLEWLWRLILQPRRIKRIFSGVFGLSWLTFKNMVLLKKRENKGRKKIIQD